ncbi:hypothetical protein FO519_006983 [Halicephalobus sp. NKZ332]|nr:hypothetical protein FO519_006983 [Halicephalobus sp. NKZ332]
MRLKEISHWGQEIGLNAPWVNKDWQNLCEVLSKVLADALTNSKHIEEVDNVTYKVSFNSLLQIAEDTVGIPQLIVEEDLSLKFKNVHLALLTYVLSMKQTLSDADTKLIRETVAPRLVFECNVSEENLPSCVSCGLYAFLIERIIVDMKVWHRRCFLCSQCNKQLYRGSYRLVEQGRYECVEHFSSKILGRSSSAINNGSVNSEFITQKVEELNPFSEDDESFKKALTTSNQPVKLRVPPPRPPPPSSSRATEIIQKQIQEQQEETKEVKVEKPIPPARSTNKATSSPDSKIDISEYPGFLNPFGTDDEDESESSETDYDDNLNPFAEEDEGEKPPQPKPSPTPSNGRPSSQPPAPPKPPRTSLLPPSHNDDVANRITTLPRAKKTYKAPPPPIPIKRKIEFTENKSYETLDQVLEELKLLQQSHEKLETQGKGLEKEILFALEKDGLEWKKNKKVEEWISIVEQKCSTIRREAVLIHIWLESYLNEIHADTEYQLRCVLDRCEQGKERSQEDINREAELLEVLVDIMGLKNGMIESGVDPNSLIVSKNSSKESKSHESKMKKMKKRLKKLKKKI